MLNYLPNICCQRSKVNPYQNSLGMALLTDDINLRTCQSNALPVFQSNTWNPEQSMQSNGVLTPSQAYLLTTESLADTSVLDNIAIPLVVTISLYYNLEMVNKKK